jgi:protein gp37
MGQTKIPYAQKTWSPATGCLPDFPCYQRCWARSYMTRFHRQWGLLLADAFKPTFHPEKLNEPLTWKKPQVVLVGFLGDLFCDIQVKWFMDIILTVRACEHHQFLFLTKRVDKLNKFLNHFYNDLGYADTFYTLNYDNLWLGTSISTQADADTRIPELLKVDCKHRWLSVEPIISEIDIGSIYPGGLPCPGKGPYVTGLDWIVVGGETGPGARPAKVEWFKHISDQCRDAGVPYYWKQWGSKDDGQWNFDYNIADLTRRELPKELQHG